MKVTVIAGDPHNAKVRVYDRLTQKGVNSLISGISQMRLDEGFQDQPFKMIVSDEVPADLEGRCPQGFGLKVNCCLACVKLTEMQKENKA